MKCKCGGEIEFIAYNNKKKDTWFARCKRCKELTSLIAHTELEARKEYAENVMIDEVRYSGESE